MKIFRDLNLVQTFGLLAALTVTTSAWAGGAPVNPDKDPQPGKNLCSDEFLGKSPTVAAKMERGVDGDTARVLVKGKSFNVRFLSIDTPETHFNGKSQGHWGDVAAARLTQLLPAGTEITLEFEGDKCDKYGRMLAHVWRGNMNVNRQMVSEALATNYCIYPNVKYCREYGELAGQARGRGEGMWSDKTLLLPYEWRMVQRGESPSKFVADIRGDEAYLPEYFREIPSDARVFFMSEAEVHASPYRLVKDHGPNGAPRARP